MSWIGNPAQAKAYRSPWFTEQKYPHGEGISNVQNKTNKRRLDQFGSMLSEEERGLSVPGPLIRQQSFPGIPSPQNAKHESSSIFYNYEDITLLNRGYKTAPYWRFGQWSYAYPEYLKLTCLAENIGYIKVGEDEFGAPVLAPIGVSVFNTGTFLLKQSSGYEWTNPDVSNSYRYATDNNRAWSVTYVPCYSITSKSFPSPFCNWNLSFRPFHYMDGSENVAGSTTSPYTWNLSCFDLKQLRTTNYIYIIPPPISGGLRFTYGLTTSLATWIDTGNLEADTETYRALLQTRFNGITTVTNGAEVFTAYVDSNVIVYKVHIEATSYQVLALHTNTTGSDVTIEEDVSGATLATSGVFHYFIPQAGFSKPNGVCKDTRELGIFDRDYMTTLVVGVGAEFFTNGEVQSAQGLSHGSLNLNKSTPFRLHTAIPASRDRIYSNPSFFNYPGWHLYGLDRDFDIEQQLRYDLYEDNPLFSLTVEPIYL